MKFHFRPLLRKRLGTLHARIILVYLITLFIPFIVVFSSLIENVRERNYEQRQNVMNSSVVNYVHIIDQYLERVLYVHEALQSNTSLRDILLNNTVSVSNEVYTYNRYVEPLFQFLRLSNDIESIAVYRRYDSLLKYNQYFMPYDDLPLSDDERATIRKKRLLWKAAPLSDTKIRYDYYGIIALDSNNIYLGVSQITIDLTSKISSLILNGEVRLEWRDLTSGRVFSVGGDSSELANNSSSGITSLAAIEKLNAEIMLYDLANPVPRNLNQAIILGFALLAASSTLYYLVLWRYIRRISGLTTHINRNKPENALSAYVCNGVSEDEIGTLIKAYNELIHRVNDLITTQYIAEINRQKAENYAMQMQINPHFLYNALECLRMTAYEHNDKNLSEAIYTLARFMHYNFTHTSDVTTFSDEIAYIRLYFSIMTLCLEDRFVWHIAIDPGIRDFKCPFFILQPIIENSFTHGIQDKLDIGEIRVLIRANADTVFVCVCDNGCGIAPGAIDVILDGIKQSDLLCAKRVGLKNVYARMKLFFGEAFDLKLENAPDHGAVTSLVIPVKEEYRLEHTLD